MVTSTDYLDFIKDQLASWKPIITKKMFGTIGLYADGLMFGIIAKDTIYFKVDVTNKNYYLDAGSAPLRLFKNDTIVPSFYDVPVEIIEDSTQFVVWAEAALAIQITTNKSKKIRK
ncbi:TfoX/Sxy family protein [Olleya sp. Bg11-27]|uniref:TfoX/Sxy family protein n=1 Tax=Olleya sp. Bg11-27 TaxID=2058135 RepID=UPI000C31B8A2|nr:TfoX/Sxy family protein [Olleya sp. Bg11-27]AUC76475.1 competence protein TfoX [Olleya sp. Bg11-27]